MRSWIVLLIVVVAAAAVLFALGVFDPETEPATTDPDPTNGNGDADPGVSTLHGPPPKERPAIDAHKFERPTKVLLLVGAPQTFNAFLAMHWNAARNVDIVSWTAPPPSSPGSGPPPGDRLPGALGSPPKAGTLDDEDIDVVVLHDIDPKALEDEFWLEVAKRVEDGRLGLLAAPASLHHLAMFEHPIVGPLLPVTKVKPLAGPSLPGAFGVLVPFRATSEGQRHPASRLVPWPRWSAVIWDGAGRLETPWGTKFTWAVESTADGAQVLLRASPETGEPWPVLIAGDAAKGRVLWYGAPDLGSHAAHGRPSITRDWDALVKAWLAWLSGELTE